MSNAGGLKYCYKNFPWISKDKDAYTFNYQKSLISLTKLISRERERGKGCYKVYMGTWEAKMATTCVSVLSNQMDLY